MARIRTIKPELPQDVKLASCSREARYTFILLITQSDDEGLVPGAHRQLLGLLYPHDDEVTTPTLLGWIEELVGIGAVRWRSTVDGAPILELVNWSKHQRVDNKGRSQLAGFLVDHAETRREPPRTAETRGLEVGSRTKEVGSGSAGAERPAKGLLVFPKALCDAGYEAFVAKIGSVAYPRYRKALLPVYQSRLADHPTEAQLVAATEAFKETRDADRPQFQKSYTVETFAQQIHKYVKLGLLPHVDEWGDPTERGRLAGFAS